MKRIRPRARTTWPRSAIFILILLAGVLTIGCNQTDTPFVPTDFAIPQELDAAEFRLRPLSVADAKADYEAVMESKQRLRKLFDGTWPEDDFGLAQNTQHLKEHESAFRERTAFTYSIVNSNDTRILGCVYLYPVKDADVEVLFWIRDSAEPDRLAPIVKSALQSWLRERWPFREVRFYSPAE